MHRDQMLQLVQEALAENLPDGPKDVLARSAQAVVDQLRPQDRKVVVSVETPYRPPKELLKRPGEWLMVLHKHVRYARAAYRYCLLEGVAPFASHLNYAQPGVLDDETEAERWLGIKAGKAIERAASEESWFFMDLGMSSGMQYGLEDAKKEGRPISHINLGSDWGVEWLGKTKNRPI